MRYIMKKPETETERILRAICSDYPRRKKVLQKSQLPAEVLQVCLVLNQAVDESMEEAYAVTQVYAPNFSEVMLKDIAECRGFAYSPLSAVMCEGSYKKYKRMVKNGIATRLGL